MESKDVKEAVKNLLRTEKIRLWEPPYTDEAGNGSIPDDLVKSFGEKTGFDHAALKSTIEALRVQAVKRAQKTTATSAAATPQREEGAAEVVAATASAAAPPPAAPAVEAPSPAPQAPIVTVTAPEPVVTPAAPAIVAPVAQVAPSAPVAAGRPPPPPPAAEGQLASRRSKETVVSSAGGSTAASNNNSPMLPRSATASREALPVAPAAAVLAVKAGAAGEPKSGTEEEDGEHGGSGDRPKKQTKMRTLTNMFKKKKKTANMISFANDAFFLAQAAGAGGASGTREEPMYFDQLSEEQQAAYLEKLRLAKEKAARGSDAGTSGSERDTSQSESEAEDVGPLPASSAPARPMGWKRSASGTRLVLDTEPSVTADLSGDVTRHVTLAAESSTDAPEHSGDGGDHGSDTREGSEQHASQQHKKGLLTGGLRNTLKHLHLGGGGKKKDKSSPSVLPVAPHPIKSDFKANEMKMTDAQRIEVMKMVKNGQLTIDEAIQRVLQMEKELHALDQVSHTDGPEHEGGSDSESSPEATHKAAHVASPLRHEVKDFVEPSTPPRIESLEGIEVTSPPLRHASMSRPANKDKRPPSRSFVRSARSSGDSPSPDVLSTDAADPTRARAATTGQVDTSKKAAAAAAAAAAASASVKKSKSKDAVVGTGVAPSSHFVDVGYNAKDLKMTDAQRIQVMVMVKEGKMTVDEAIRKVLEVEASLHKQNAPKVDADGFVIVDEGERGFGKKKDAFEEVFTPPAPRSDGSSDEEEEEGEKGEVGEEAGKADGKGGEGENGEQGTESTKKRTLTVKIRTVSETNLRKSMEDLTATPTDAKLQDTGSKLFSESTRRKAPAGDDPFAMLNAQSSSDPFLPSATSSASSVDPFATTVSAVPSEDPFVFSSLSPQLSSSNDPFAAPSTGAAAAVPPSATNDPFAVAPGTSSAPHAPVQKGFGDEEEEEDPFAVQARAHLPPADPAPAATNDPFAVPVTAVAVAETTVQVTVEETPAPVPEVTVTAAPSTPVPAPRSQASLPTVKVVVEEEALVAAGAVAVAGVVVVPASEPVPPAAAIPVAEKQPEQPAAPTPASTLASPSSAAAPAPHEHHKGPPVSPKPERRKSDLPIVPPRAASPAPAPAPTPAPAPAPAPAEAVWNPFGDASAPAPAAKPSAAPQPAKRGESAFSGAPAPASPARAPSKEEVLAVKERAAASEKHSKIWAALNPERLVYESEEDKAKREKEKEVLLVGYGARLRTAEALLGGSGPIAGADDLEGNAEKRIEELRKQAQASQKEFANIAATLGLLSPEEAALNEQENAIEAARKEAEEAGEEEEDVGDGSFNIDEGFLKKLEENRRKRDEEEAKHRDELARKYAEARQKELEAFNKEQEFYLAQKRAEEEQMRIEKEKTFAEAMERAKDYTFNFTWGAPQ